MEKHMGKCALCGEARELTYEHIPPRSAFNNKPAQLYSGQNLISSNERMPWDVEGLNYISRQKGAGTWSLCASCNNLTGTWYGDTYKEMAHIMANALQEWKDDLPEGIAIKDIYAARFIKQTVGFAPTGRKLLVFSNLLDGVIQRDRRF